MIQRRHLLLASALSSVTGLTYAAEPYVAGKHYFNVVPPVRTSANQIEVFLFFAYFCPHCIQFEPIVQEWAKTLPKDVVLRVCPVAWRPSMLPFTQAYFALEALDLHDKLHMKFFESVVYQERPYDLNNGTADIRGFMVDNGVDGALWDKTMNSFSVHNKARQASMTWQMNGIDSTPSVGVAGLYTTGPHLVGTRRGTLDCLNYLIDKARKERKA